MINILGALCSLDDSPTFFSEFTAEVVCFLALELIIVSHRLVVVELASLSCVLFEAILAAVTVRILVVVASSASTIGPVGIASASIMPGLLSSALVEVPLATRSNE